MALTGRIFTAETAGASEKSTDPFAPYMRLEGLPLTLKYSRNAAKELVLDLIEAEYLKKMEAHGYTRVDNRDPRNCVKLQSWRDSIPVEALSKLDQLIGSGVDGESYIYRTGAGASLFFDTILRFERASRWTTIQLHQWS